MMGALIAGGLDAVFDPKRQRLNDVHGDEFYQPNPAYYEPSRKQINTLGFPRMYKGKLFKVLHGGVANLAPMPDGLRVIFMWRNPEEIRQSYEGFFTQSKAPLILPDGYEERMRLCLDHLANRRDVLSVTEVRYREDAIDDPAGTFARISADGWPIDVQAAASTVKPELCRFRLEGLEVGI